MKIRTGIINQLFLQKIFIPFLVISVCLLSLPVRAEPQAPTEYQVKAAFIFNFAKFVEWPAEASPNNTSFVIGIVGQDPFGGLLDEAVSGKTIRDKKITVRRFSKVEDAVNSQILFVSGSEEKRVDQILKQLGRAPVLTVSDIERFAGQGGMVQLLMDQNKVRFAINVAAVERAGLKPSSQLLKLARIVPDGGAHKGWPFDETFSNLANDRSLRTLHHAPLERGMSWSEVRAPSS